MASVYVTMGQLYVEDGAALFYANAVRTETISSEATSVTGNLVAGALDPSVRFEAVRIECATPVIVTSQGPATASNGARVSANVPEYLIVRKGERISVIDA